MGNIRQYTPQNYAPRFNDTNAEAAAGTGLAISRAAHQIGQDTGQAIEAVGRHYAMQETSQLTNDYAQTFAKLTKSWNDTATQADPNALDTADNWREQVLEPELEKFGGDNLITREGNLARDKIVNEMRMHFFEKTTADQSALGGIAVKSNLENAINTWSSTAYADPSSLETAIRGIDDTVNAQIGAHRLTPEMAATVREQISDKAKASIAMAAARGMAENNPAEFQKALAAGRFDQYLNGDQQSVLSDYADRQTRAKIEDAERQKRIAREDAEQTSLARRNEIMQSWSANGRVSIPGNTQSAILSDPKLLPTDKDVLIDMAKRLSGPDANELKNDPGTYISLFNRIHLPDGDPRKITDENMLNQYLGKGLNFTGITQLRGEIQGRRTEEGSVMADLKRNGIETMKHMLTGTNELLGLRDPNGDENLQRAMQVFLPAADRAIKAGENPADVYSMDGLLGKTIAQFKRDPAQMLKDIAGSMGNADTGDLPTPKTPADAQKLAPGTRYRTPDGRVMVR